MARGEVGIFRIPLTGMVQPGPRNTRWPENSGKTPLEVITLHYSLLDGNHHSDDRSIHDMMAELSDVLIAIKTLSPADARMVANMLRLIAESSPFDTLKVAANEKLAEIEKP